MSGRKGEPKPRRTAARRGEATVDQNLVKALAHPLRVEILAVLNDRMASPNELAKTLNEGLSQVSYHVKVLRDLNCIHMVKTEPRRGAVEHFYQAITKAYVTTDAARKLPKSARRSIWGPIMRDIDHDVETSVEAGTFDEQPHHYVGRVTEILDGQGLEEADALATEFSKRFEEIGRGSVLRRSKGDGDGQSIPTTAATLVFGSFLGKELGAPPKAKKKTKTKAQGQNQSEAIGETRFDQ